MRKNAAQNIFALIIALTTGIFTAHGQINKTTPTERGDKAVERLKQNGQYDSLIEAVKAARTKDGQTETPTTENAVGQNTKLTASDGAESDFFSNRAVIGATIWTQEAQKVASDGAGNDQFGYSVAISGDTAIVGARSDNVGFNADQGSAYIFVRNGTVWTEQQQITATGGAIGDQFGWSVAISGDTVIVGAPIDSVGANFAQGSAYIFTRSGTVWTQQAQLIASDGAEFDQFGLTVSISGETVVVGSYQDDVGANSNQGSAYVFVGSGGVWSQQAKLTASDGAANDQFGWNVAISGETVVVGASLDDVGANTDQGSAYIFVRSGTDWSAQQKLSASDGEASDTFGYSVSISGETLIVGASFDSIGGTPAQGSAYIFTRSGTVWTQQAQLTASDGAAVDNFGYSVSIDGDMVIVGAYQDDLDANDEQGSAYIFARNGTVWTQQQKLSGIGGAASDNFGNCVGISGDKIIVGAPFSDASVNVPLAPQASNQGSAYFFLNNLIPTAANVSVSGRVLTNEGENLRNAVVTLTKPNGETVTARTGSFGFYKFDELTAGETYILSVISKRYTFTTQIVTANENLTEVDFIAAS